MNLFHRRHELFYKQTKSQQYMYRCCCRRRQKDGLQTPAASGHARSVCYDDAGDLGEGTLCCPSRHWTHHCWRCGSLFVRRQELTCASVWPLCCCWQVSPACHRGLQRSSCTQTRVVTSSLTYLTLKYLAVDCGRVGEHFNVCQSLASCAR